MSLSNVSVVAFHYRSYGIFCIHSKRLHNLYSGFTHYRNYRAERIRLTGGILFSCDRYSGVRGASDDSPNFTQTLQKPSNRFDIDGVR